MLKTYAMREAESRGRRHPEDEFDTLRGIYERDIDRVIHSRAFKRMAGKTQVITGRLSDHHRTRLTHSIEVATLCRSVARRLGLNPHLSACLGFCHDLGHPPLGHSGEDVLNEICLGFDDRFEHNRHTLTIIDEFEEKYATCPGLNLSFEVREGIIKHSLTSESLGDPALAEFDLECRPPLESQLVDCCDEICYSYSDLDDALEAGFLNLENQILPELDEFRGVYEEMSRRYPAARKKLLFNETLRRLMNATVTDMTRQITTAVAAAGLVTVTDVRRNRDRLVSYSPLMTDWISRLKQFLHRHYYQHPEILNRRREDMGRIRRLFDLYFNDISHLPRRYREMAETGAWPRHKVIVYYIAGFTDFYFFQIAEKHGI